MTLLVGFFAVLGVVFFALIVLSLMCIVGLVVAGATIEVSEFERLKKVSQLAKKEEDNYFGQRTKSI